MTSKSELRKEFSQIRSAVTDKAEKDIAIADRLFTMIKGFGADCVLLYSSFRSEIDMWRLFDMLRSEGIAAAFPLCGENGSMSFHIVESHEQLHEGSYGILEPDSSLPQPVITDKTVCIVPGLAFTESGMRLGYGGGYYDRLLAREKRLITVSAAYEALITNSLPTGQYDIPVRYIATEERTVLCNE